MLPRRVEKASFGDIDTWNDRAVSEQVTDESDEPNGGDVYIVPVLDAQVDQFKNAPEGGGEDDQKGQVPVKNEESFTSQCQSRIGHGNI